MSIRFRKILLPLLAIALLTGAGVVQNSMNRDRDRLGLTHIQPLENAPPMLAFTTVALGGFRGLISNMLWIRANELQEDDKFFEMVQLSDWITKLEPHFAQVWAFEAWNMAWNISVKFKDFPDRWRWVQRGIELLRDEGLRYNPDNILIHRELAWIFQNKMGASTDDASTYYKTQWAHEMMEIFGRKKLNLDELAHPQTEDEKARAQLLREKYKMDPQFVKEVDERYGPLEWRLPEASAIYWAALGLKLAEENPSRINKEDLIMLRRAIYQSMLVTFQRGHLIESPLQGGGFNTGPNLDIIPKVNASYEEMLKAADEKYHGNIATGHRHFLLEAVYFLYVNGRTTEAAKWYKYLAEKYPNQPVLDFNTNSLPATLPLDEYAFARVQGDVTETSRDRIENAIEGLLFNSYHSLIEDEDDRAATFKLLAKKIWTTYQSKIFQERIIAVGLPPLQEIDREIRDRMLNPEEGLRPEFRAVLRTKLGLPAETTNAPPAITNAPTSTQPPK
jgi:hypothetical protein